MFVRQTRVERQDQLVIAALRKFLTISDVDGENLAYSRDLMLWRECNSRFSNSSNTTIEHTMSTTNIQIDTSQVSSPEEFAELCKFAAEIGLPNLDSSWGSSTEIGFMVMLLTRFNDWVQQTGLSYDVLDSVQILLHLLRSDSLRTKLANIAFKHGLPTDSQIDSTLRLLFQAAVSCAAATPRFCWTSRIHGLRIQRRSRQERDGSLHF